MLSDERVKELAELGRQAHNLAVWEERENPWTAAARAIAEAAQEGMVKAGKPSGYAS